MGLTRIATISLACFVIAGCTEKGESTHSVASSTELPPPFARLQITAGPSTPHTVGTYDPASAMMIEDKSKSGALMFGPYVRLPVGKYRATYLVAAEGDQAGVEVGRVDVSGYVQNKSVDIVSSAALKTATGQQSISLMFDATNPEYLYEFRVWTNGKGRRVALMGVSVERL